MPERNRDLPTPDAREQRGISGDLARFTLPVHARRRRRALKSVNADYDIVRVELKNPSVCLEQWSREVDLFLSILGCTMNRLGLRQFIDLLFYFGLDGMIFFITAREWICYYFWRTLQCSTGFNQLVSVYRV